MIISHPKYVIVTFHSTLNSLPSVLTISYPHMSQYHLPTIDWFECRLSKKLLQQLINELPFDGTLGYGARVRGTKTYIFNPSLRLVLYQFLHTVSLCCHETIHYTQQTATNTATMMVEPLAPPGTMIWSIHMIQCAGDVAKGLGEGTGQRNTVVTLKLK